MYKLNTKVAIDYPTYKHMIVQVIGVFRLHHSGQKDC